MLMPDVARYMTRDPYSIESRATMARARELMTAHRVRHLPVIDGDRLVGIITDRDVEVMAVVPGLELAHVRVARVMAPPILVRHDMPLDEVSLLMAREKADCVVVQGAHGIEGIFTAIDALQALAEVTGRASA